MISVFAFMLELHHMNIYVTSEQLHDIFLGSLGASVGLAAQVMISEWWAGAPRRSLG